MRLMIASLTLVLALAAPAATFPVATAPLAEAPEPRSVPELAAGRDGWLAAWIDGRSGAPALLAARIAADGTVLDPTGLLVAPVGTEAKVVWTGDRYLVFFSHGADLVLRSVGENGEVGPIRTVVANALLDESEAIDAATNGQRIVIAYAGDKLAWNIRARMHAAVLAMDGTLLDDLLLDGERTDRLQPSIAPNGTGFAVAWNRMVLTPAGEMDGLRLNAVRLDARGARLDAAPRDLGHTHREAVLRANGSSLLLDREYESSFVSADLAQVGAPVDRPNGRFFTLHGNAAVVDEELGTMSGVDFPRFVRVVPYDEQGRPGAQRRVLQATEDGRHAVGGASASQRGDDLLIAWMTYDSPATRFRLFTTLASATTLAPKGTPRLLTRSAAAQRVPALATGESEALVAWTQPDGVYAARVTSDGRRLDGPGIRLDETMSGHPPAVAYDRGRYAVAYGHAVDEERWEVVVRFVSPIDGLLPEQVRIPVARWAGAVALASGGGSLILVWTDDAIRATRIHAGGAYDPPVEVVGGWSQLDPVISWNGTHFLIAWTDGYLDWDIFYEVGISGRRMTPELQLADAEPRSFAPLGQSREHAQPALASNGSEWFVTWMRSDTVRIARIGADGTVDDPAGTALARGFGAELVWTGTRLVMAWQDDTPGQPLVVAPLTADARAVDAAARRTLEGRQVSLARWGSSWAAAYAQVGGVDVGWVPRAMVTVEPRTRGKARAIR